MNPVQLWQPGAVHRPSASKAEQLPAMTGVAYIQRLNTKGGVAPSATCDAASKGRRQQVAYEADYAFYGA